MKITKFEDLQCRQEARALVNMVYEAIRNSQAFLLLVQAFSLNQTISVQSRTIEPAKSVFPKSAWE